MPPRKAIESLPKPVQDDLNKRLAGAGFKDYRGLAQWLKSQGFTISKSSLQRYGASFEERLAALKLATDRAKAVVESSPDEPDAMSQALARLVQEKLFTVLLKLEVDPEKLSLPALTRAIADLGRASLAGKRWAEEWKTKAQAEVNALKGKEGTDKKTLAEVEKMLHGL